MSSGQVIPMKRTTPSAKKPVSGEFFMQLDALQNFVSNFGTGNDRRSHTEYVEQYQLDDRTLEAMYVENWLAGKIVDIIPDDMTREWREFDSSQAAPAKIEQFTQLETDLDICGKFNEALKWGRLYGGAGIIIGLDEAQGGSPDTPLDINKLGKGCLTHLTVIECGRLQAMPDYTQLDPTQPGFGEPEFYTLSNASTFRIHRSRVLAFDGIKLPYYMKQRQFHAYWGASVLRRVFEAIVNADMTVAGGASLVSEASTDVIKYKGLTNFLLQPGGEEKIQTRFALAKLLKSVNNVMLLDEDETFEQHQQSFSGLGDLLDRFLGIVAGAADIPETRLLGSAAKGLNSTGEGDLSNYYDNIRAAQKTEFNPNLRILDKIMQRSLWGSELKDWGFTWNSLFQMSDAEKATTEQARSVRDTAYLAAGVVDEYIVAQQLAEDGTYTNLTPEYLAKLKAAVEAANKAEDLLALPGADDPTQKPAANDPKTPAEDRLAM
jgi:phage-related protein, HI1409 family